MRVQDNEFPVVVQAFETRDKDDVFVAEQVVSTQTEVDNFTSRYAGRLIKVRALSETEVNTDHHHYNRYSRPAERRKVGGAGLWVLVLLVLVALVVAGFTTGWIQRTLGVNLNF